MTTVTMGTYKGKTAEQWRAEAARQGQDRYESQERCDTDGFISQWASGVSASEYELCAELAETDGWWEFMGLFDLEGNLLTAVECKGDYGYYWLIKNPPATMGKPFFRESNARKGSRRYANDTAKGVRLGTVRRKGYVTLRGSGTGLAGAMSVRAVVVPDKYSDEVQIVDNGTEPNGWYQDQD